MKMQTYWTIIHNILEKTDNYQMNNLGNITNKKLNLIAYLDRKTKKIILLHPNKNLEEIFRKNQIKFKLSEN